MSEKSDKERLEGCLFDIAAGVNSILKEMFGDDTEFCLYLTHNGRFCLGGTCLNHEVVPMLRHMIKLAENGQYVSAPRTLNS